MRPCHTPPLGTSETDALLKMGFQTIYFTQTHLQNAGNAILETQISKYFLELCCHYGLPLTKILATPLLATVDLTVQCRFALIFHNICFGPPLTVFKLYTVAEANFLVSDFSKKKVKW